MTTTNNHASDLSPCTDLDDPSLYLNRELTWLAFNRRVLHEAQDERTPLLERVKFVAIVSANLDEFFMKRIGGLKQQVGAGVQKKTIDGRTAQQQILECYAVVRDLETQKQQLVPVLLEELKKHSIFILDHEELTEGEQDWVRQHYIDNIYPLITPQSIDPAHPFPFISNQSLNLLVTLHYPEDSNHSLARVKIPIKEGIPRFIRIGSDHRYVRLEDVMAHNLDMLFPGMEIEQYKLFRVSRNSNVGHRQEAADDLLEMIASELRERRFASIVRLEVEPGLDPVRRGMLAAELGLNEETDVFEVDGIMALRSLFELAGINNPALHDLPHQPVDHPKLIDTTRNIFHIIREVGSILLQHPYQSFSASVERFLYEASEDPKVQAIKMTLYRTSSGTKVIDHLIRAAENGKQVAVVVELKARFDEEANIHWASRMEEAGIHVTYGVVGLKTHCKVILVVRRDYSGLRRYIHIGTGNYHAGTARLYSDFGLLTCDPQIGSDATELFNYLTTGYTPYRNYHKLLPAPKVLKPTLIKKIRREINLHKQGGQGHLQFKMNALEDFDITKILYEASQAGVKVDLIVRDTCRLRPGLLGISENITIISIVGRFLEHTRIYYFHNGGQEEYYIGSADSMTRNLEQRVEVLTPIEQPEHRADLRFLLDTQLNDHRGAWEMDSEGTYTRRISGDGDQHCQEVMIARVQQQLQEATRLRKRKVKGPTSSRNLK